MSEFNNRISTQRDVLKIVNGLGIYKEPLFSLTEKAINRWASNNNIAHEVLISLLKAISGNLFFLANRSQEQITDEYSVLSDKIDKQLVSLKLEVDSILNTQKKQANN